ncbi:hypothetical protein [Roseburia hominis]|uniref:hypothetical protein n=1 Tax=Roseburia hominis TaxID=301301 RepID=UPI0022E7E95E|nr:hypothetical protein [Roseburia hominis]
MGESFQKLNLTNAYLFAAALQDEEICRNLPKRCRHYQGEMRRRRSSLIPTEPIRRT